jgi:S1-C subfamily serine protease
MVLDGGAPARASMVSDLDFEGATGGVKIDEVNGGSPAEKAGLKAGDVVVDYDGERVRSARQFTRLVQETPDGRTVTIGLHARRQTADGGCDARRPAR